MRIVRTPNVWIVLAIILSAILIAMALAAVYFVILERTEQPPGRFTVTIEGQQILVEADQSQLVMFADGDQGQAIGQGGQGPEAVNTPIPQPTNTPIPQPTNTPIPQPAETAVPITTPVRPHEVIFEPYQVAPQDTLYRITTIRNTTIPLMARFGISAASLVPGRTIELPVANPAFCVGNQPYVVERGDTLVGISIKCNTTVDNLKQINGFGDSFRLDITQVICVPPQG